MAYILSYESMCCVNFASLFDFAPLTRSCISIAFYIQPHKVPKNDALNQAFVSTIMAYGRPHTSSYLAFHHNTSTMDALISLCTKQEKPLQQPDKTLFHYTLLLLTAFKFGLLRWCRVWIPCRCTGGTWVSTLTTLWKLQTWSRRQSRRSWRTKMWESLAAAVTPVSLCLFFFALLVMSGS